MNIIYKKIIVVLIACLALYSCSSSKPVELMPSNINIKKTGVLLLLLREKSGTIVLSEENKKKLANSIIEKITMGQQFSRVYYAEEKNVRDVDLILRCDIAANRSDSKRNIIVVWGEKAYMNIVASFVDPKSNKIIASRLLTAESSAQSITAEKTAIVIEKISSLVATYALED